MENSPQNIREYADIFLLLPSQYGEKKLIPDVMNASSRQNEPTTTIRGTAIATNHFRSRDVTATDSRDLSQPGTVVCCTVRVHN